MAAFQKQGVFQIYREIPIDLKSMLTLNSILEKSIFVHSFDQNYLKIGLENLLQGVYKRYLGFLIFFIFLPSQGVQNSKNGKNCYFSIFGPPVRGKKWKKKKILSNVCRHPEGDSPSQFSGNFDQNCGRTQIFPKIEVKVIQPDFMMDLAANSPAEPKHSHIYTPSTFNQLQNTILYET